MVCAGVFNNVRIFIILTLPCLGIYDAPVEISFGVRFLIVLISFSVAVCSVFVMY